MKKIFTSVLIMAASAAFLYGDICIKLKAHSEEYYYGGITQPAVESVSVMWLGKDKAAVIGSGVDIVIDREKNRALLINTKAKTYVETPLPIDLSILLPDQYMERIRAVRYKGAVAARSDAKIINKKKCKGFDINTYFINNGNRNQETDATLWTTSDLPFDAGKYKEIFLELLRAKNFGDALVEEFKKIDGFTIFTQSKFYPKGFAVNAGNEVLEMSEKQAPQGIYSIPGDFKKLDKLTIRDFLILAGID